MKKLVIVQLISLLKFYYCQDNCYPSVVRHRIDSVFPTSQLFCVSRQNDNIKYNDVAIVETDQQWKDYAKARGLEKKFDEAPLQDSSLISIRNETLKIVKPFELPASISIHGFCTGTQFIDRNRNTSIKCKPIGMKANIQKECENNKLLNAFQLFGSKFVEEKSNSSEIKTILMTAETKLIQPIWNGSACIGALQRAELNFILNGTRLSTVEMDLQYHILSGKLDPNSFEQEFSVKFLKESQLKENSTLINDKMGYKKGEVIYSVNGIVGVPFSIPSLNQCYSTTMTPVRFGRDLLTTCTIATKNCDEARKLARKFLEQVYPLELLSAPSDDAHPALIQRINVTWDEASPMTTTTCRLPVSSILHIFWAKQGSTKDFREIIVAGIVQLKLDYVSYTNGQDIRIPVNIKFSDATPELKSVFASLPYIDIRLPNDFFYPFIKNQSSSQGNFVIFGYFLAFSFFSSWNWINV